MYRTWTYIIKSSPLLLIVPLFTEEDHQSGKWLFVRLPIRPQTVAELQLTRFWLRTISQTCFQLISFFELLNPELIKLLFLASGNTSPVQFLASELLTFYGLPPLAYGLLAHTCGAVKFYGYYPFPALLQLVCTFPVAPRQVEAGILDGYHSYSDRKRLLFKVGQPFPVSFVLYNFRKLN
jgi:hypothetical protein